MKKKPPAKSTAKKAAPKKPAAKPVAKKAAPAPKVKPKLVTVTPAAGDVEPRKPGQHPPSKPAPAYAQMQQRGWAGKPPPHKLSMKHRG
jgi:DnaK suppressor protein